MPVILLVNQIVMMLNFVVDVGAKLLNKPTQSELPQPNVKLSPIRHLWLIFYL